jgi:hypothetical protein
VGLFWGVPEAFAGVCDRNSVVLFEAFYLLFGELQFLLVVTHQTIILVLHLTFTLYYNFLFFFQRLQLILHIFILNLECFLRRLSLAYLPLQPLNLLPILTLLYHPQLIDFLQHQIFVLVG